MSQGISVVMVTEVMLPAFTRERYARHSATYGLVLHKELSCIPLRDAQRDRENHNYLSLDSNSGFPGGSDGKASAYNAGDPGLIPGSGRSSGEGNGNPLQYSCLENPMDGGAW